jgi:hypothetical protein
MYREQPAYEVVRMAVAVQIHQKDTRRPGMLHLAHTYTNSNQQRAQVAGIEDVTQQLRIRQTLNGLSHSSELAKRYMIG